MPASRALPLGWLLVVAVACGPLSPPRPDGGQDAGSTDDAGPSDAGDAQDAGPCDGGRCLPERLNGGLVDPLSLVVDDTHLYWLEYGLATNGLDGELNRQRKDTPCLARDAGCIVDLNTDFTGRFRLDTLTLAGEELCWTEHYANARDVICQSTVTNAERTVASNQNGATEPWSDGAELLWVTLGTTSAASDGAVLRKPLGAPAGSAPLGIASGRPRPTSVTAFSSHFVWTELGVTADAGAVWAQPFAGGAPVPVAQGLEGPLSVVNCNGAAFWATYSGNAIMRATSLAAGAGAVLVPNQKHPFVVLCDERFVYWLNAGVTPNGADGELWLAQHDGGAAERLVAGISLAFDLAQDATHLYWIAQGTQTRIDGQIWRLHKP